MTTVFISGTWEILHVGHIYALKKAAALGDLLVVGVVTDNFAEIYKKSPLAPYEHRLEIISSLRMVDKVAPHRSFSDYEAMMKYNVAIRVIGPDHGNYEGQRKGLEWCKERGIEVVVLEKILEMSTTIIKEKIREQAVGNCDDSVSNGLSGAGSSDAASFDPRGYSE